MKDSTALRRPATRAARSTLTIGAALCALLGLGATAEANGTDNGKAHGRQATRQAAAPATPARTAAPPKAAKPRRAAARRGARRSTPRVAPKPRRSGGSGATSKAAAPARKAAAPSRKAATPTRKAAAAPSSGGPVPNSGCTAHKDPRDPGSCQEKGGGNSGDIDPYRGPDSPGNDPSRGNDCDEGGGNNRTAYPRKTNPRQPGDSPVDSDRGKGNNRCAPAPAATAPSAGQKPTPVRAAIAKAGKAQDPVVLAGRERLEVLGTSEEPKTSPGVVETVRGEDLANRLLPGSRLPTTGADLLLGFLLGGLLAAVGAGMRTLAARPS